MKITCVNCKTKFTKTFILRKYCSIKCQSPKRKCKLCSSIFIKRPRISLNEWRRTAKFCSKKCQFKYVTIRQRTEETNEKRRQTLLNKYKDPAYIEMRRKAMIKSRHPKHPGHGAKVSATLKRLHREGILKGRCGKENYAWKGGKSFEEYTREFNDALKEQIRFRDGYKCQRCGCPQIEHGKALIVHHKDCNKKNNKFSNLISLCMSCHITVHWEMEKGIIPLGSILKP